MSAPATSDRWRAVLVCLLPLLFIGAACGDDDGGGGGEAVVDPVDEPTDDGSLEDASVSLTEVATVDSPTALVARPGTDDLYVTERGGRVRLLRSTGDDALEVADDPVLDISADVTTDGERGLLGLEFSAGGNELYVSHTNAEGDSRLVEYAMDGDAVDEESRRELLAVDQPFPNHNGGDVHLGPDGFVYYGPGDGGNAGDPEGNGQDTTTLLGAMLRIDPTAPSDDQPYGIPDDNPFADGAGESGDRPEIFLYGVRNPYRFSFDAETDDLWIADVGQQEIEEINWLPPGEGAGANLGWNLVEGTRSYEGGEAPPGHVPPVFEYDHTEGRCSVTGGVVYRGEEIPELRGSYLFGDFCAPELSALRQEDGEVVAERGLEVQVPQLVGFGTDADHEVYVLSLDGTISRLGPG